MSDLDFDKIVLTRKEWVALSKLRRFGSMSKDDVYHFDYLFGLGFVDLLEEETDDAFSGFARITDTCVLTEEFHRYAIFCRRSLRHRYLTPVTVSIATTTVLYMSQHWLLPVIQWLLSHLPGFHP